MDGLDGLGYVPYGQMYYPSLPCPMSRRTNLLLTQAVYYLVQGDNCVYCGELATGWDHLVPVSFASMLAAVGIWIESPILPCCSSCNTLAGSMVFKSVGAKRRFIQQRLRTKYADIINMPAWSEVQQARLGFNLRTKIKADLEKQKWLLGRLGFRSSFQQKPAKIKIASGASILHGVGSCTVGTSAGRKTTPMTERRSQTSSVLGGQRERLKLTESQQMGKRKFLHQKRCENCGGLFIAENGMGHCRVVLETQEIREVDLKMLGLI